MSHEQLCIRLQIPEIPKITVKMRLFDVTTTLLKQTCVFHYAFMTFPSWYPRLPPIIVKNNKDIKNIKLGVVWEVVELNLEVVINPYSTLSLQKCIKRRREVHERGLEPLHCYAGVIGALFPRHLFPSDHLLVLQSLEAEFLGEEK